METAPAPELPQETRSRVARRRLIGVLGAWAAVAALQLFGIRLANLWLISLLVFAVIWGTAIVLTLVAPFRLWRPAGAVRALAVPAAGVLAAAVIVLVPWLQVYAHAGYQVNRGAFADVVERADAGEFRDPPYYGEPLPARMRLVAWAKVTRLTSGSDSILFVPVYGGVPDGGAGFGYVGDGRPGTYDCFGDPCRARWSLGDGWYWIGW